MQHICYNVVLVITNTVCCFHPAVLFYYPRTQETGGNGVKEKNLGLWSQDRFQCECPVKHLLRDLGQITQPLRASIF